MNSIIKLCIDCTKPIDANTGRGGKARKRCVKCLAEHKIITIKMYARDSYLRKKLLQ
jgi:hypothetical protein